MSNAKKQKELNVLNQAIEIGINEGTEETKKILSLLNCADIEGHEECPDFVRFNTTENLLIGIEHFRVDHYITKIKNNRVGSTGVMYKKKMMDTYNEWKDKIRDSENIPDGAIDAVMELISNQLDRSQHATYNNFIHSFKYNMEKHIGHLDNYWIKLNKINSNINEVRMAFLVEIYCDFSELYLNCYNKTYQNKEGVMPFFRDVVKMIEDVDTSKIHYFIFCLKTYDDKYIKSYAFESSDFVQSLKKQNLKIYEYSGVDYLLPPYVSLFGNMNFSLSFNKYDDRMDLNFDCNPELLDDRIHHFLLMNALKQTLKFKKLGFPYACDRETLGYVYVFGDHINDWIYDTTHQYVLDPILRYMDKSVAQKRNKKFEEKFPIEKINLNEWK